MIHSHCTRKSGTVQAVPIEWIDEAIFQGTYWSDTEPWLPSRSGFADFDEDDKSPVAIWSRVSCRNQSLKTALRGMRKYLAQRGIPVSYADGD